MRDTGSSQARRVGIATVLVGAVLLAGYGCYCYWPVTTVTIDPLRTPFYGPYKANGFVHPSIHDTQGLRRAHKLVVAVVALVVLLGSTRWWRRALLERVCGFVKVLVIRERRARRLTGRIVLIGLLGLVLAREIPSLGKTPDLRSDTPANLANLNAHITMTLGPADRLAAGDVLFRETTPHYGVLVPVLVGIYQRHFGLIPLGDHVRWLVGIEILYWIAAGYLFVIWSRGHWLSCVLPIVLLLEYYWSATDGLAAPNHSPLRTAGLTMAMLGMTALRRASARTNQWAAGLLSGLAVLTNVESGIAATLGLVAYLYRRFPLDEEDGRWSRLLGMAARFCAGFLAALIGFVLLYRAGCGSWPHAAGLKQYFVYARLSSMGYGSRPFRIDLYPSAWVALWPLTVVTHTIWSVCYTAQQRPGGFRPSFRIAVGTSLLVWFAYFANRPEPGYIGSYLLPYGLLLIDLGRYLGLALRRPRACFGIQAVLASLILCHSGIVASRVIDWSWNPSALAVKPLRWGIPLVWKGSQSPADPPRFSKAYLPESYSASLRERAGYLRRVACGRRLVYFTIDSYLMPRLSHVLPLQEFSDPAQALTRSSYDRLLRSVVKAPVETVYIDSRRCADLIWYGGMFDLLRKDLSRRFQCEGVEHGWEIWRRRAPLPVSRGRVSADTTGNPPPPRTRGIGGTES
jgi:hypothetical protein